jgi:general secretion pathway protein A
VFQDGVVERIHGLCSGVPRMINGLCDRLLLFGCIEERQALDIRDVETVGLELRREVGTTSLYGSGTELGAPGQLGAARVAPSPLGSIAEPGADQVLDRVRRLEEDVSRLRQLVKRERQLLRKAILIQLDLGAYDDFE